MNRTTLRSALLVLALTAAACGSGDDVASDADADTTASTAGESEAETTTTTAAATTTEAETTTTVESTTTEAPTTTTEPAVEIPDPPPAGTGVLTVGESEFAFTIETCNTEPAPAPIGDSILVFEIRGSTVAEGQAAEARLLRIAPGSGGPANDSFGWGYATDPNNFETLVAEGSAFGIGEHIVVEQTDAGLTFYGPPTPFERTEGISVIDDAEPGMGSIIATC